MEMNRIVEYLKTGLDKYKYVLIICLCGFVLVSLSGNTDTAKENETQTELTADTALLEQRLERSLSQISGVGKAEVILTAKSSSRAVYAYDEDKTVRQSEGDRTADTSQSMAFSGSGSGQLPIQLQTLEPEYRGALVVCEGAASAAVRLEVTKAVAALTGIGSDHIVFSKMK